MYIGIDIYIYIHIYVYMCIFIYVTGCPDVSIKTEISVCFSLSLSLALSLSRSLSLFEILKKAAVGLCSRSIILNPTICKGGLPFLAFSAFRFSEAILDITDALCDMSVRTISIDI